MIIRVVGLVLLALVIVVGVVFALDASINWQVISSGGGLVHSGPFSLYGTIGQPVAGVVSSPNHEIQSGFWTAFLTEYELFLPTIMR